MSRGQNKWTGSIAEEAIERVSSGVWHCEIPFDEKNIGVTIIKSGSYGSYLVIAGGDHCRTAFQELSILDPEMSCGVLVLIQYSDNVVPALELPELRTIIDEADEVIIAGPSGRVIWDRLSNKRFRSVDESMVLSEAFYSMRKLDLLGHG